MAINRTQRDANFVSTGGLTLAAQKNLSNPITFAGAGNFLLSPNFKPAQASVTFAVKGSLRGRAFLDSVYSDGTKVSLSNNFLTVTAVNVSGANTSARSNADSSSGTKLYCSASADLITGTAGFGICNSSQANTTGLSASLNAVAWFADGTVVSNSVTLSTIFTFTTGDYLDMALDTTNSRIWFRKNAGIWNNNASADPATNTGGIDISSLNAGPYFPAVEVRTTNDQFTLNFDGAIAPVADNVNATWSANFANNLYWYNNGVYATFANWIAAVGFTYTRASAAYYTNSIGILTSAAVNEPRFDFDPITLAAKGLLYEGPSTNLLLWSQAIGAHSGSGQIWDTSGNGGLPTLTDNSTTSPDGTVDAAIFQKITVNSSFITQMITKAASALSYTFSIYAKQIGAARYFAMRLQGTFPAFVSVEVDLQTGTFSIAPYISGGFTNVSGTITQAANGFFRCTLTGTSDTATTISSLFSFNSNSCNLDGTDSALSAGYVFGPQLEQFTFSVATSYILTTSASASRAADSLIANPIPWVDASTNSLLVISTPAWLGDATADFPSPAAFSNVTGATTAETYFFSSINPALYVDFIDNNVQQAIPINFITAFAGTQYKVAFVSKANDFAATYNGNAVSTDTSGTVGTYTYFGIGNIPNEVLTDFYGTIKQVSVWAGTRVSNNELVRLTT